MQHLLGHHDLELISQLFLRCPIVKARNRQYRKKQERTPLPQRRPCFVGWYNYERKMRHHLRFVNIHQRVRSLCGDDVVVADIAMELWTRYSVERSFRQLLLGSIRGALDSEEVLNLGFESLYAAANLVRYRAWACRRCRTSRALLNCRVALQDERRTAFLIAHIYAGQLDCSRPDTRRRCTVPIADVTPLCPVASDLQREAVLTCFCKQSFARRRSQPRCFRIRGWSEGHGCGIFVRTRWWRQSWRGQWLRGLCRARTVAQIQ